MLIDRCFHFGAVDVLSAAEHHVFGTIDDEHIAVLVNRGDVTSTEPAILNRFGCGFFAIQVPLDDHSAAHAEFTDAGLAT